jgi:hypothetical protein
LFLGSSARQLWIANRLPDATLKAVQTRCGYRSLRDVQDGCWRTIELACDRGNARPAG